MLGGLAMKQICVTSPEIVSKQEHMVILLYLHKQAKKWLATFLAMCCHMYGRASV